MATEADVAALFTSVLGRAPDAGGLAYYADLVNKGATLAQVQQSLASSPEAQVRAAYSDVFGRSADAAGQKFYADQAIAGTPMADIRKSLAYSPEAQGLIENIYTTDLKRASDTGGKQYYTDLLAGGGLLSDVQKSVQASTEAQGLLGKTDTKTTTTTGLTAAQLEAKKIADALLAKQAADALAAKNGTAGKTVTTDYTNVLNPIYREVFGRDVDASGLKFYGDWLAQGKTAADIKASLRGSAEFQSPGVQTFQKGIKTVPFGSQLMEGQVKQVAQYGQPAAQAGAAQAGATMGSPSLQGFLGSNPAASTLSPFQQQMQYQAALPSMIQPFNPADIPATYQQQLNPTPRLDISSTTIPGWLQTAINEQKTKDGVTLTEQQKFTAANPTVTNSGLGANVSGANTIKTGLNTTTAGATTGGLLSANQITPSILNLYPDLLGRTADLGGASYYQTQANQGMSIADIIANISGSPEGLLYAPTRQAKLAAAANTTGNIVPD
jgi:hypothetical protein